MSRLEDYANKYQTVRFERRDGILQVTLHTEGQSLRWGFLPHGELPEAFHDIGGDRDNRVVILTGTGAEFSGPRATPGTSSFPARPGWERIDRIHWEGRHLLMRLLEIEVPVISAINGPAWRHSEIPLLCDIVLAADWLVADILDLTEREVWNILGFALSSCLQQVRILEADAYSEIDPYLANRVTEIDEASLGVGIAIDGNDPLAAPPNHLVNPEILEVPAV